MRTKRTGDHEIRRCADHTDGTASQKMQTGRIAAAFNVIAGDMSFVGTRPEVKNM